MVGIVLGQGGMQWYLNLNLDPSLFPAWVYPRFPDIRGAGIVEGITNVLMCGMACHVRRRGRAPNGVCQDAI